MLNQILREIQGVLKGPNGTFFLIVILFFGLLFFLNILPLLLRFGIPVVVIFFLLRFLKKYKGQ